MVGLWDWLSATPADAYAAPVFPQRSPDAGSMAAPILPPPPYMSAPQFVDAERLSRVPSVSPSNDAMYANRFNGFPASANIEDRRNEAGLHGLLQSWTSLTPDEFATALRHPMTPYWDLRQRIPSGENQNSQLAIDAGINDIGLMRARDFLAPARPPVFR